MSTIDWSAAPSRALRRAVVTLGFLTTSACGSQYTPAPQSPPPHETPDHTLYAGVARADITPPPGLSLFGHGPEARVSVGTLLRLYCEAFVFVKGPEAVALVPCDLAAMSVELHRAVADRVRKSEAQLGADRIVMMATHTHAGPAHYFGAQQYSSTFSSRAPGFDPDVRDFLADRIATSIIVAFRSRVPARIGWSIARDAGLGLVKSRSFDPFTANRMLPPCLAARMCPSCMTEPSSPGDERACGPQQRAFFEAHRETLHCPVIDPAPGQGPIDRAADLNLSVLAIEEVLKPFDAVADAQPTRPLGAFAVFGVHNTGISNRNDVFHSDVFGYALRQAELRLNEQAGHDVRAGQRQDPPSPILVGIANGIEGDVSPAVGTQSIAEAHRLGTHLGDLIAKTFAAARVQARSDAPIRRAYRELRLPGALAEEANDFYRLHEPPACSGLRWEPSVISGPRQARLCETPELGAPAAGGAEDGPTWLRIFPLMNEGNTSSQRRGCQGHKLPIVAPTGRFEANGLDFPNMAPVTLVQLGSSILAAVPFEMTTVVGTRIRDRLELYLNQQREPIEGVVMVGLANSYLQYVTTPDEYERQHYEGASTLYGPETARFLGNHLLCLADSLYGAKDDAACRLGQEQAINAVSPVRYSPMTASRLPKGESDPEEFVQLTDLEVTSTLTGPWPSWVVRFRGLRTDDALLRERLVVRIVEDKTQAILDDDAGSSMEIRYDVAMRDGRSWLARWTPRGQHCGKVARFVVGTMTRVVSKPFQIACSGPLAPDPTPHTTPQTGATPEAPALGATP
jgi:neutral ceramidase